MLTRDSAKQIMKERLIESWVWELIDAVESGDHQAAKVTAQTLRETEKLETFDEIKDQFRHTMTFDQKGWEGFDDMMLVFIEGERERFYKELRGG